MRLDDVFPAANAIGLALAQRDEAIGILDRLDEALDFAAFDHGLGFRELVQRNATLGLVVDIHDDQAVVLHLDDLALDDLVGGQVIDRLTDRIIEIREVCGA